MNTLFPSRSNITVSAGCHINDVMNESDKLSEETGVSAGCHINDVMN